MFRRYEPRPGGPASLPAQSPRIPCNGRHVTLAVGTRLGPYEILSPLGAGGMGEVYRARDERLKREVAIKVLVVFFSRGANSLRRFEQEAMAAGVLNLQLPA